MSTSSVSTGSQEKSCGSCNSKLERPLYCSGCNRISYCDEVCQRAHWKSHKNDCIFTTGTGASTDSSLTDSTSLDMACEACRGILKDKDSMRCGGCQTVSYCNADCQRAHWKVHKKTCKDTATFKVALYLKNALAGVSAAQFNLGLAYASGVGVTQNFSKAVHWYRKAADAGYVDAQFNLALLYRRGTGVKVDLAEAFRWTRAAAEAGFAMAQFNLGRFYLEGNVVLKDLTKAVYWNRAAAEAGHAKAQCVLGECYFHGYGVTQDFSLARHWLQAAADQGDEEAAPSLDRLTSLRAAGACM
jgi:TPR repeat protein